MDLSQFEIATEIESPDAKREEWLRQRMGLFTCSRFGDLMQTDRSGKPETFSQTGMRYLAQVAAQRLGSAHSYSSSAMQWGTDNEPLAIAEYERAQFCRVDYDPIRFFQANEYSGGSPDGLVGETGVIEVKCPYDPAEHFMTVIKRIVSKPEYEWQIHGHLMVTGRHWCDFVSFDPRIETQEFRLVIVRVWRDERAIRELMTKLELANRIVERWLAARFEDGA